MPRKSLIALIIMLLVSALAAAAAPSHPAIRTTATPSPTPTPIPAPEDAFPGEAVPLLMLTVFDPWNMVLGSDSPRFVLYDTGLVIYQRQNEEGDFEFVSVQLTPEEADALLTELAGTPDERQAFFALEPYYDQVMITDQPTSTLYLYDPAHGGYTVSVYGELNSRLPRDTSAREGTPEIFLTIFDNVITYRDSRADVWQPDFFEVVVWPYDTSSAVNWPSNFPDLDDPTTIERDNVYSLYLPIEDYQAFAQRVEGASAIRMNGQTWAFSVRYPFPHEYPVA